MIEQFETLRVAEEGAVLFVTIDAPPMNMLGPELVRDLVSLIEAVDDAEPHKVVVFKSADPDYFISHVDVTKIAAYRAEAAKLTGEASIALLFRRLSETKAVMSADDYDADLAERYGWVNRAFDAAALGPFVSALAHRIAGFPVSGFPRSRNASMRSLWPRSRIFAATPTCSAKA